jgi:hypothetical protein
MDSPKPAPLLVAIVAIFFINYLKEFNDIFTMILQWVIGLLTVTYLILKIKSLRKNEDRRTF